MAKTLNKVKITAFKSKTDSALLEFANLLTENGKDKDFDPFRATLTLMATEATDFGEKLLKAANKGLIEKDAKDKARQALLITMEEYSYYITGAALRNPSLILRSGFVPQTQNNTRPNNDSNMIPPYGLNVIYDQAPGQITLSFELANSDLVVKNIIEISDDKGVTWKALANCTGKKKVIKNLAQRTPLLIRVRSIGTYGRESDYSIPFEIFLP